MYIDYVGLTNTLTWIVTSVVAILVAARGLEFGRAFVSGVYRNRAFWIAALGVVTVLQALPGFVPNLANVMVGAVPLFEVTWFTLLLAYFAFVDSTILVTLQMDFFHRDALRWRKARIPILLVLVIFVAAILFSLLGTIQSPGNSLFIGIPLLVSLFFSIPYSGVALVIGVRRTQDRTLKRHLTLLALVFILYISNFVEASVTFNNPGTASILLDDLFILGGVYVLYQAVMTLSPVGRIEAGMAGASTVRMRQSRRLVMVLAIVLVVLLALVVYTQASTTPSPGPWTPATDYPLQSGGNYGVFAQSCASETGHVYCVGGAGQSGVSSQSYSSTLSSSGVGAWVPSTGQYPKTVAGLACVTSSGFLYCVGGTTDTGGDDTALSYFAPVSSGAIGDWTPTTSFPTAVDSQTCFTSASYIYCLGGTNEEDGTNATSDLSNSAWYAPLSSAGIGNWVRTTSYPQGTFLPACAVADAYVFCVGGVARNPDIHGGVNYFALSNTQGEVYFAPLSSEGIGTWKATTSYPIQVALPSCVASSGYLYCVGGEQSGGADSNQVYIASTSATGLGTWHQSINYPAGSLTTCVVSGGNLACLGGFVYDTCIASISNLYCLNGNEGTYEISGSIYYIQLSLLAATPG